MGVFGVPGLQQTQRGLAGWWGLQGCPRASSVWWSWAAEEGEAPVFGRREAFESLFCADFSMYSPYKLVLWDGILRVFLYALIFPPFIFIFLSIAFSSLSNLPLIGCFSLSALKSITWLGIRVYYSKWDIKLYFLSCAALQAFFPYVTNALAQMCSLRQNSSQQILGVLAELLAGSFFSKLNYFSVGVLVFPPEAVPCWLGDELALVPGYEGTRGSLQLSVWVFCAW